MVQGSDIIRDLGQFVRDWGSAIDHRSYWYIFNEFADYLDEHGGEIRDELYAQFMVDTLYYHYSQDSIEDFMDKFELTGTVRYFGIIKGKRSLFDDKRGEGLEWN